VRIQASFVAAEGIDVEPGWRTGFFISQLEHFVTTSSELFAETFELRADRTVAVVEVGEKYVPEVLNRALDRSLEAAPWGPSGSVSC